MTPYKQAVLRELSHKSNFDDADPRVALAAKIDALIEPSREIDAEIAKLSGFGFIAREYHYEKWDWYAWHAPERRGAWEVVRQYTSSLDEAMNLADNSGFASIYLKIAEHLIAEEFGRSCASVEHYRFELAKAFCIVALYSEAGKNTDINETPIS